jgi:hypothetical protein
MSGSGICRVRDSTGSRAMWNAILADDAWTLRA